MPEYKEFRFRLYPKTDARLLDRIVDQANGAGENNAARFLLRHWFEIERQSKSPQRGQTCPPPLGQDTPDLDEQLDDALSAIDNEW